MSNKQLTEYENKVDNYLNDKSVLELVDTMMYLDHIKPGVELSKNGEVGEFLEKKYKDIPVHSVKDFNSFYESLNNKISQLADTDQKLKIFLEQTSYQRELNEFPQLMNKLKRINFEELKPKFEAVMEYVYDAVMNEGFEIDNIYAKIFKIDFIKNVKPKIGEVRINIKTKENYTSTSINLSKKKYKKALGLKMQLLYLAGPNQGIGNNNYSILNIESITKRIVDVFKNTDNPCKIITDLKTILSLPKIMNDHLKKRVSNLEDCLKDIKEDGNI